MLAAAITTAIVALTLLPAAPASAHPLGNFSVNQYVGLTVHRDRIEAVAVVDLAEIPTLQDRPTVDADRSGSVTRAERTAHATERCAAVSAALPASASGTGLQWTVSSADLDFAAGTGGLEVSRLTCRLVAAAALAGDGEVTVRNSYLADRVGWREMTAVGVGLTLVDSPLPAQSASDELRRYPDDPLAAPLDVRSATLRFAPASAAAEGAGTPAGVAASSGGDPVSRWMATVDRQFQSLAGGRLNPAVVLLTVGLALLLGAGHAALPGHGKTVLAAYLAGRRGRPRDALTVAATVTLTHTGGVLVLGLVLTAGTAIAGERILGWLGLASGVLVLAIGATMLVGLVRGGRALTSQPGHGPHGHHHDEPLDHCHGSHRRRLDGHHHGASHGAHDHGHHHDDPQDHGHGHDHHPHPHAPAERGDRRGRLGLAGIGLAGGLVPSPSALLVLLAAIGLGRAGYGILLVVAYGAGMALTLAAAGLLLLALQRRLERRAHQARAHQAGIVSRLSRAAARLNAATPAATATLVVLVGMGLAARAAAGIA